MKVEIEIPDFVSEEEIKDVVKRYIKKKQKYKRFYELVEGVNWNEIRKEVEEFRRNFRFRKIDD